MRSGTTTRTAAGTFVTGVVSAALSLGNVMVHAHVLGPSGRGLVAFLTTVAMLTAMLSTLGVQHSNANLGVEPGAVPSLAGTSVVLAAVTGSVGAGSMALLLLIAPGPAANVPRWLLVAVLIGPPVIVLTELLEQLVTAQYQFAVYNASLVLPPIVNVTTAVVLAMLDLLTPAAAVLTWIIGQMLCAALLVGTVLTRLGGFGRPQIHLARGMLAFGLRAHLGRSLDLATYRVDQWIVGTIAGSRSLGLYSVAVAWSEGLFLLPSAVQSAMRPDLVRASAGEVRETATLAFRATLMLTLPAMLLMVALAPVLCTGLLGPLFADAVPQLRVLALGAPGIVALKLFGTSLVARRFPLLEARAVTTALVTMVALDFALIPAFAGLGAAIASTVAYNAGGAVAAFVFLRTFGGSAGELLPHPEDGRRLTTALRDARHRLDPPPG